MLSPELLLSLNNHIPCRELQIKQFAGLVNPALPNPQNIVLYGTRATGKTLVAREVLSALECRHAFVKSKECITGRHLLERTVLACKTEVERHGANEGQFADINGRCENLSALAVQLQRLLSTEGFNEEEVEEGKAKFVLVFDGVDRQREAPPTLLPALARLGEIIPNLIVVFIVTHPRASFLHLGGVPHIDFTPYTRSEALPIVSQHPLEIFEQSVVEKMDEERRAETEEDNPWLWGRFCGAVWDSLGKTTSRDIISLRTVCERLWLPFVKHIRDGTYGTRDFARLMVRTRALFQSEDALTENILSTTNFESKKKFKSSQDLSYYTKFLLIASYLASHNPPRQDQTYFMKSSESKRKKKGGAVAKARGKPAKHRKVQRKMLGPQLFVLERMMAIFHAIMPHSAPVGSADIMTQIATLISLGMIVRGTGATTGGAKGGEMGAGLDIMDPTVKWRCNVGWEFIKGIAKTLRFEVEDFVAE